MTHLIASSKELHSLYMGMEYAFDFMCDDILRRNANSAAVQAVVLAQCAFRAHPELREVA